MCIYQCYECEKELTKKEIKIAIPEENKYLCPECFYKLYEIIK